MSFTYLTNSSCQVSEQAQAPVVQNLAMWVSILSLWALIKFNF